MLGRGCCTASVPVKPYAILPKQRQMEPHRGEMHGWLLRDTIAGRAPTINWTATIDKCQRRHRCQSPFHMSSVSPTRHARDNRSSCSSPSRSHMDKNYSSSVPAAHPEQASAWEPTTAVVGPPQHACRPASPDTPPIIAVQFSAWSTSPPWGAFLGRDKYTIPSPRYSLERPRRRR